MKDYLLEYCYAYRDLIGIKGTGVGAFAERNRKDKKYRETGEALIQYLADTCRSKIRSYDDLQMLCELYYPLLGMDRELCQIQREIKLLRGVQSDEKENAALFYLERMRRIATSLLTYRDGIMAIRTWNNREEAGEKDIFYSNHISDKVEIWNMLSGYVSPDLFMALFMVESELGEEALYGQKAYISLPDKLLVKVLRKGMSENHLHFNAGYDYEAVWLNKMNLWNYFHVDWKSFETEDIQNMEAALFRLLCIVFLSENESALFVDWAESYAGGVFVPVVSALYTGKISTINPELIFSAVWEIVDEEATRSRADYLLETILFNKMDLKTSSEFILLYYCCQYIRRSPWDTGFARIFLQYIRIKNWFVQKVQQSVLIPGLKHFQKYFDQMKGEELRAAGRETMMLDAFRAQSKIEGLKKLEIRIAPDVNLERLYYLNDKKSAEEIQLELCRQLFRVFSLYRRYILEETIGVRNTENYLRKEQENIFKGASYYASISGIIEQYDEKLKELKIPVLGIVYHFIKKESADNISGYHCWRDMDYNRGSSSNHRFFLRERMSLIGIVLERLRVTIPGLNEYIVGVDAASDENAMEPWMLSQTYMKMRSKTVTHPVAFQEDGKNRYYYYIQNMGFTYHVGEDYRHIVSGLRHIDEVIEHFYYKPGDRLGHALALGKNIESWIRDTEVTTLPVREYMENLLWIWGKCINSEIDFPVQLEVLEEKILYCAEKIYKNLSGISVRLLYQAYEKKFSPTHRELLLQLLEEEKRAAEETGDSYSGRKDCNQTYCKVISADCIGYEGLWTLSRLISTLYCPVFEERGKQVEMVPVHENEIELYKSLQEHLLKKVSRRGIYIEMNPTSNLIIGDMKDLLDHPIFRLSPLQQMQERNVLVTINSDDPAVFNTNVENELAYVYYALERAGCSKDVVLQWIDKIRQNGMEGSFISKEKDSRTLLEESSHILDLLIKLC